jgi:hypothetical protein
VLVATLGLVVMVLLGAAVSGSTAAIAVGLLVVGFASVCFGAPGRGWRRCSCHC